MVSALAFHVAGSGLTSTLYTCSLSTARSALSTLGCGPKTEGEGDKSFSGRRWALPRVHVPAGVKSASGSTAESILGLSQACVQRPEPAVRAGVGCHLLPFLPKVQPTGLLLPGVRGRQSLSRGSENRSLMRSHSLPGRGRRMGRARNLSFGCLPGSVGGFSAARGTNWRRCPDWQRVRELRSWHGAVSD